MAGTTNPDLAQRKANNAPTTGDWDILLSFVAQLNDNNNETASHAFHVDYDPYETDESERGIDYITIHSVGSKENKKSEHYSTINVGNKNLRIKVDTVAETSVLTNKDFNKVVPHARRETKLHPSNAWLTAFGGHAIPVIGQCHLTPSRPNECSGHL